MSLSDLSHTLEGKTMSKIYGYSASDFDEMPVLCCGQTCNLFIDDGDVRVWLSRCTVDDGEPFNDKITIEVRTDGCWEEVEAYQG